MTDGGGTTLHQDAMGEAWNGLAPAVRRMHDAASGMEASGTANIARGRTIRAHVLCAYLGLPRDGQDVPVTIRYDVVGDAQVWTRTFAGKGFSSTLRRIGSRIEERVGPLRFRFRLKERDGKLRMVPDGWSVMGLPLPRFLQPSGVATESGEGGDFILDVPLRAPLFGDIVHFAGRLRVPDGTRNRP